MTLQDTLAGMLSHQRMVIAYKAHGVGSKIPSGQEFTLSHAGLPPSPSVPTQVPKCKEKVAALKPIHLTDPDIVRSYNANRVLGDGERAYIEHRSMTWQELSKRRYERHERY